MYNLYNTPYYRWFLRSMSDSYKEQFRQMPINVQKDAYVKYLEDHYTTEPTGADLENLVNEIITETVRGTFDFIASDAVFVTDKESGEKIENCEINGTLKSGELHKHINKRVENLGYTFFKKEDA